MVPNLLVSISAPPKKGKTHLAMTFPAPIAVFSFDLRGAELLLPKFEGKKIDIKKYSPPISPTMDASKEDLDLWEKFYADYKKTMESGEYATMVIDPATMLWEVVRNAYIFEKQRKNLMRRDYGTPNARMAWVLQAPILGGMNVVSVNYVKPVYDGEEATKEVEIDGFKRTEGLADFVVFMETVNMGKEKKSRARIEACRFDRTLDGFKIDDARYEDLIGLLGV